MPSIILYEQYKFVEKKQSEVHGAWKGIHLLLFFLAFVFGSFCTFCFHMLMYMFEDKCILYPKLLSLNVPKSNLDFVTNDNSDSHDFLPVDFVSTQWLEESHCYLPTFVPLLSGIFGLIWTTMFLMCSTGSSSLTGLQRPWRILFPIFIFSVAKASLCLYTTIITQNGLMALCTKLSEITGSTECTFTVNVATLLYERRVKGVYQAMVLTIMAAWLHTGCWIMSAVVIVIRVILAVDFNLIRVTAVYNGPFDSFMPADLSPETSFQKNVAVKSGKTATIVERIHLSKKQRPPSDFSYVTGRKSSEDLADNIGTVKQAEGNESTSQLQIHYRSQGILMKSNDTFISPNEVSTKVLEKPLPQDKLLAKVGFEASKAIIASRYLLQRLMFNTPNEEGSPDNLDDKEVQIFIREHQAELNKLKLMSAVSFDEVMQKFVAAREKEIIASECSKQWQDTGITVADNQSSQKHTASQTVTKRKQDKGKSTSYSTCNEETEVEIVYNELKDEKFTQITKQKQD